MNINAIIHEQIDWYETAKSFQFKAMHSIGDLWIAFPSDYDFKWYFVKVGYAQTF
jgi:hypothetical protein